MFLTLLAALATATCEGTSGRFGADVENRPLFEGGRTAWVVSVPDGAERPLWYAAEELQSTVKKISGATLGIVRASESPGRNVIVLGTDGDGWSFADVFSVCTEPGRIGLTGNSPRGVLFAVYAFLRERLGCRWYWPGIDGEYLPKLDRFEVSSWKKTYRPYFPEREMSICGAWRNAEATTERWFPKVFLNGGGRTKEVIEDVGFIRAARGHHISLPYAKGKEREKLFAEHPDWFSLINGERSIDGIAGCWSNEGFFNYVVSNLTARIRAQRADIANFYIADIVPRCQCANCTSDPDKSARFWKYYAKIIEAIRKEIPGQHFAGLAYQEYRPVPGIKVEGVDYVDYCQYNRCYYHLLSDTNCTMNAKSMAEFRRWREQAPLGLFGYEFDVYRDPVYVPMWDIVAEEMRIFREMELRRVKTELSTKIAHLRKKKDPLAPHKCAQMTQRLSNYCWAMLAFDPDLDPKVLVRDFCDHVYGPGADAMFAYHMLMARIWVTMPRHISYFLSSARTHAPVFLNEKVEKEALAHLTAAAAATKDDLRAAVQVKLDADALGVWQQYVRDAKKDGVIHELVEFSNDAYNMVPWLEAKAKKGHPQETRFKLYRGKDALHLLVDCKESESEWFALGSSTNDVWKGTTVEIFIDTGDYACRQLAVMPAGGIWDAKEGDLAWSSGATVRPTIEEQHWQLDITLPYAGLGGKPKSGDRWKFMVIRNKNVGSTKFVSCGWPINAHRDFGAAATLVFK